MLRVPCSGRPRVALHRLVPAALLAAARNNRPTVAAGASTATATSPALSGPDASASGTPSAAQACTNCDNRYKDAITRS